MKTNLTNYPRLPVNKTITLQFGTYGLRTVCRAIYSKGGEEIDSWTGKAICKKEDVPDQIFGMRQAMANLFRKVDFDKSVRKSAYEIFDGAYGRGTCKQYFDKDTEAIKFYPWLDSGSTTITLPNTTNKIQIN